MDILTKPLESATRKEIDRVLSNTGWKTSEFKKDCNVFTERVRTKEEVQKIKNRFPKGRFPDYVLYKSETFEPLAIIEAKRVGSNLNKALEQGTEYASCIDAPIVFAIDGAIVETKWIENGKFLRFDGQLITELVSEKLLLRFTEVGKHEVFSARKNTKTKEELIHIFKRTNDLLREEGMREGVERFTEFSNLLFLKLIDEIEEEREQKGHTRRIEKRYTWDAFYKKPAQEMLDYINDTVLPKLVNKYNHSGDVFSEKLGIQKPTILKKIVDELSELTLLDIDSDIKGDAFEYFLKNSVTVGNDLGEYYTPRHIVKLVVDLVNPKFGDKVYDPACGTGGFLIEAFRHIARNTKQTKEALKVLENETIYGGELTGTAKIAKMNMILAGDGHTHIKQQDSLANPRKEEFDIVLTNFPFSQSTDYAHLYGLSNRTGNPVFLKHVIDSLKRGGRAGVVVPDGVLFGKDKDSITVRKILVENCRIEAIIQMSVHTFSPYTKQPTSILIFEKGKRTDEVWFFEVENDGFMGSTKKKPIETNDLPILRALWNEKDKSEKSFKLPYENIDNKRYKLFMNFYKKRVSVSNAKELGEVCEEIILGGTPNTGNQEFYGGNHLWVTIADMKEKHITDTKQRLSDAGAKKLGDKRKHQKGTLLMSFKLTLGKTAFAGKELYTNEAICALNLKKDYNTEEIKEYLYHILPLVDYVPYAQRAAKGYTLNKELVPTVEIPFPQNKSDRGKIIKRKESLTESRKELEKNLEETKKEYEQFIQSEIMGHS
jgi:type I restriction enzyme M protein